MIVSYLDIKHILQCPLVRDSKEITMRLLLLWASCALVACGGGGDNPDTSPPRISTQPAAVIAYETQSANFHVTASTSHGQISYQWMRNGDNIPGETASTLTLSPLSVGDDQTQISVAVSNGSGTKVSSESALLTVKQAVPRILTAPTPQTIDAGQTATFTVSADGLPPLSYQWYKNSVAIPNAITPEYTTPVQAVQDSNAQYSVKVSNSMSTTVNSGNAPITVFDPNLKNLIISEISVCMAYTDGCWFEIYNPTENAIDLSKYQLKTTASSSTDTTITTFNLPAFTLYPGTYKLVSGNIINAGDSNILTLFQRGTYIAMLNSNGYVPDWSSNGFLELLDSATNKTVDFVKFDTSTQNPVTADFWSGGPIAVLPHGSTDYGKSLVRQYPINTNTRSNADWTVTLWVTPGGRNDISNSDTDSNGDNDGIPVSSKLPGHTFGGLDLYAMGARKGQRDIFIEIDFMDSTDPGVIPRKESLQMVVDAFARHGIAIHFDAGDLFSSTFNPALFNLGQSNNKVPYESCVTLDQTTCTNNLSSRRSVYDWKQEFMDPRRRAIFHYLLMGYTQFNTPTTLGSSGIAEINGNDLVLTMGNWGFTTATPIGLNKLVNQQASAIMHELGHNLGLRHGGDSNLNYKPNYISVMNYMYSIPGLPQDLSGPRAYQRWLYYFNKLTGTTPNIKICDLDNSSCGTNFVINYSDGSGLELDENNLLESKNIGHGSTNGAYADWSRDGTLTSATIQLDLNPDGGVAGRGKLHDYNDWANLKIPFNRDSSARFALSIPAQAIKSYTAHNSMINDRQPSIAEDPPSQDMTDFIRNAN